MPLEAFIISDKPNPHILSASIQPGQHVHVPSFRDNNIEFVVIECPADDDGGDISLLDIGPSGQDHVVKYDELTAQRIKHIPAGERYQHETSDPEGNKWMILIRHVGTSAFSNEIEISLPSIESPHVEPASSAKISQNNN